VVAAGMVVGPVVLAGMGVVGSVGANFLTDVIKGTLDKLRSEGKEVSQELVEAELTAKLEEALQQGGESAAALRGAIASILREADAPTALMEATERDSALLPVVMEGLAALGEQFSEFAFMVDDVRHIVREIDSVLLEQQAVLRVEQERTREQSLMLLRVLEIVEHSRATPAGLGATGEENPAWQGNPYMGLLPFEERDSPVFYGRTELAGQLVRRLAERLGTGGILLVIGASGAGKSSLLRAGMIPRLAAGALGPGSQRWPRRLIRPTSSPLGELAITLADLAGVDSLSVFKSLLAAPDEVPLLVKQVVRTATGQDPSIRRVIADDAAAVASPRLVLVIDQFEELFTAGEDKDTSRAEREAFVAALHAAATVPVDPGGIPGALVVAAVRADFMDRVIAYPPLAAAVDAGPFAVGAMSEAELRQAITGPAAEAGLAVETALVESVISDLRNGGADGDLGSGVLPLVSQAMAATWERRESNKLTLRVYQRTGGVANAVNNAAQAAYDTLTSEQQEAARLVFTRLTVITPSGQLAVRRCRRSDLQMPGGETADAAGAVIDAFARGPAACLETASGLAR
jgi:Novel STAND NTPase 1